MVGAGGGDGDGAEGEEAFAYGEEDIGVLDLLEECLEDSNLEDALDGNEAAVGEDIGA